VVDKGLETPVTGDTSRVGDGDDRRRRVLCFLLDFETVSWGDLDIEWSFSTGVIF
jgi:hypothetical protein